MLLKEAKKHLEVIGSATIVGVHAILWGCQIIAGRVTNTSWLLDVKDVCFIVPCVFVFGVGRVAVHEHVWAGLLQETEH